MDKPQEACERQESKPKLTNQQLFLALRQANPELTHGLDLDEAIEITSKALEQRQSVTGTSYVNALRASSQKGQVEIQLDPSEDALMLLLQINQTDAKGKSLLGKGKTRMLKLRCLVDSGSTISCIAQRCTNKNTETFKQYKSNDSTISVTFANDEQSDSEVSYKGLPLCETQSGARLDPPRLHELNLPDGIDCLLGMDWLKQYNPDIDWASGQLKFNTPKESTGFNPNYLKRKIGRRRVCWLNQQPEGVVSWQTMSEIIQKGGQVFVAHVTDINMSTVTRASTPSEYIETAVQDTKCRVALAQAKKNGTVLKVQSLTKRRLEEILNNKVEAELVPAQSTPEPAKSDPRHDNGKPKLFLDQPETAHAAINKVLLEAKDIHALELTPEQVAANDRNTKRSKLLSHKIELEEHKPMNRPYYRMSKPELEELKKQIAKYLEAGMIEPSKSPYGAACLFAPKKNGKLRFCIDYRPLNGVTIKNAVQPPGVEDCLQQMAGRKLFSCIDLAAGYHQIPIDPEDREKTAFNTKYGHYQWRVLPFGLCNAPATFVSALNRIFSGEAHRETAKTPKEANSELGENLLDKFLTIYLDDLIIYSTTPDEHADHLRQVFNRLRAYGLIIQSPKAFYAQDEVEYLGHMVSAQGITVQDDKIETVKSWPQPTEVSHVRQFLGLAGFYRKFVKNYASISKPLSNLTKKDSSGPDGQFNWTPDAAKAFDTLKEKLSSAPVLAIPDTTRGGFHLHTDASEYGLGATLSQEGVEDGKMHPCAFLSRALKPSEVRAYEKSRCVYELELTALMYALEKWRHLLEGQLSTTVDTDHRSLTWLQKQTELTKTQSAYLDTLARYDVTIRYLKGELNIPGDAPSRRPDYQNTVKGYMTNAQLDDFHKLRDETVELKKQLEQLKLEAKGNKQDMSHNRTIKQKVKSVLIALSQSHQRQHSHSKKVASITVSPQSGKLEAWLERLVSAQQADESLSKQEQDENHVILENHGHKLWYRCTAGNDIPPAVIIPNDAFLKKFLLQEFHAPPTIGHYNGLDMFRKMQRSYYWPGMRSECEKYSRECKICQPHKPYRVGKQGLLADPDFPVKPWSSIALDFFGPMNKKGKIGPDSILVAVCRLTKMAHYIPCASTATTVDIANLLIEHVIKHHGLADDYRSDRDKIFTSKLWEHVWSRLGTSLSLSTAYHHQTAGQVERVNQEMRRYLAIYCDSHADWKENLALAELAYNSHINASTGCTPFELNYGFQPRNPNELITPEPLRPIDRLTSAEKQASKKGEAWLADLHQAWEKAETVLRKTYTQYEKFYKRQHKDTRARYPVGSKVYLSTRELQNPTTVGRETAKGQDEHVKRKLLPFYVGPFRVTEVSGHNQLNRKLQLSTTLKERLGTDVFHIEKLKPAGETENPFTVTDGLEPPKTKDGEFHVESIIAFEQRTQGKRYLVKWEGYPDSQNTWEWEWMLENAQQRIRDFMKTDPTEKNPRRPTSALRRSGRVRLCQVSTKI